MEEVVVLTFMYPIASTSIIMVNDLTWTVKWNVINNKILVSSPNIVQKSLSTDKHVWEISIRNCQHPVFLTCIVPDMSNGKFGSQVQCFFEAPFSMPMSMPMFLLEGFSMAMPMSILLQVLYQYQCQWQCLMLWLNVNSNANVLPSLRKS